MSITLHLDKSYGFCILAATAACVVVFAQTITVGRARKRYGVPYPDLYAIKGCTYRGVGVSTPDLAGMEEKRLSDDQVNNYNCIQRVHQNTVENLPIFFATLLASGIVYPNASAALGALWVVGRVLYSIGYASGKPNNRYIGAFGSLAGLCLIFLTGAAGIGVLKKNV